MLHFQVAAILAMIRALLLSFIYVVLCGPLLAEDLALANGQSLSGVTISRVEPDGLVVVTDAGIEKVPFLKLTPELQEKYGYDPAKAAVYAKVVAQQQAELSRQGAADEAKEAALKTASLIAAQSAVKQETALKSAREQAVQALVVVHRALKTGALAKVGIYTDVDDGLRVTDRAMAIEDSGYAFVAGLVDVVDGDDRRAVLYPAGRYQYQDVNGVTRTVHAYALTPEAAVKRLSESAAEATADVK